MYRDPINRTLWICPAKSSDGSMYPCLHPALYCPGIARLSHRARVSATPFAVERDEAGSSGEVASKLARDFAAHAGHGVRVHAHRDALAQGGSVHGRRRFIVLRKHLVCAPRHLTAIVVTALEAFAGGSRAAATVAVPPAVREVCPGSRNGGGSHGMGRWVGRGKAGRFCHYSMFPDGRSGPLAVIEDAVSEPPHYMKLASPESLTV